MIPTTMSAVEITAPGGPEVLIKVAYAGVNRPDALQRAGAYDSPRARQIYPG